MIYWAANQEQKMRVIKVDCSYNKSENAFIEELTSEMRYILKNKEEEVTKKMVINDEIRFSELNPFIKKSKLNFVFLIKNTERLADMKKQIILYNLLEWMKT